MVNENQDEVEKPKNPAVVKMKNALKFFFTEHGRLEGINFKPRSTDTFVATSPKCGTTMVTQICHQLRSGGHMDFSEISEVVPWVEQAYDHGVDLNGEQVAPPRVFKTHLWYEDCPKGAKYIVVFRRPRDAAVSFFHFLEDWYFKEGEMSVDEFIEEFLMGRGVPQSKFENPSLAVFMASWWPHRNDPNVLLLFYENLVRDPPAAVREICRFMLSREDEDRIRTATEMSTREFMLAHGDHFDESLTRQRNVVMGLTADAGSNACKVMDASRPRAKPSAKSLAALDDSWRRDVEPVTGFASYDEMLAANTPKTRAS